MYQCPRGFTPTANISNSACSSETCLPLSLKCILLGDSGVGKTSLVVSYTANGYPSQHRPSALDTYCVEVCANNRPVYLQICDAGGGDEVSPLRRFSFPGAHVILLCFSVIRPRSFRSLCDRWITELSDARVVLNPSIVRLLRVRSSMPSSDGKTRSREFNKQPLANRTRSCASSQRLRRSNSTITSPGPAFLLIGCACDLRNDICELLELSKNGEAPVDKVTAERLAAELGAEAYIECSALTQKNLKTVFDLAIWCGLQIADLGGPSYHFCNENKPNGSVVSPICNRKLITSGTSGSLITRHRNASLLCSPDFSSDTSKVDKRLWRRLLCIE